MFGRVPRRFFLEKEKKNQEAFLKIYLNFSSMLNAWRQSDENNET